MNKLLLWLTFLLSAAAFVLGLVWVLSGNLLGYALTPLSLAPLLWATFKLRRINLRGDAMTVSQNPPDYATVAAKLDEIEAEMKRIGMWQEQPPRPEQFSFTQAFAMDTMAFDQWLQFVFIPRVREIVATRGAFPPFSEVAAQAVREFDTHPLDTARLHTLLHEFDRLFGPHRFQIRPQLRRSASERRSCARNDETAPTGSRMLTKVKSFTERVCNHAG